jgi:hypothetical protein
VVRLRASRPFVQNENEFLAFALTVRSSGIAGSVRLGIKDPLLAYDLDNAVALRLVQYDQTQLKHAAKLTIYELAKAWNGNDDDDPED